jgi:hypothetical protein
MLRYPELVIEYYLNNEGKQKNEIILDSEGTGSDPQSRLPLKPEQWALLDDSVPFRNFNFSSSFKWLLAISATNLFIQPSHQLLLLHPVTAPGWLCRLPLGKRASLLGAAAQFPGFFANCPIIYIEENGFLVKNLHKKNFENIAYLSAYTQHADCLL